MNIGMAIPVFVGVAAIGIIAYKYYSDMKTKEEENARILAQQLASQENSPRNLPDAPRVSLGIINLPPNPMTISSVYFDPSTAMFPSQQIQERYIIPRQQDFTR